MAESIRTKLILGGGAIVAVFGAIFLWRMIFQEKKVTIENFEERNGQVISEAETEDYHDRSSMTDEKNSEDVKRENDKTIHQAGIEDKDKQKEPETTDDGKIVDKLVAFGHEINQSRKIDTIIIHSSYDARGKDPFSVDGIIEEYREYGVATHYLIDRKGVIYRLVEDKNIAYHAGKSSLPDGRKDVNKVSLGIEMMNTKNDKYTKEQYASLKKIIEKMKKDYPIKYILGHNQIAPGRKDDPWNFEWSQLN